MREEEAQAVIAIHAHRGFPWARADIQNPTASGNLCPHYLREFGPGWLVHGYARHTVVSEETSASRWTQTHAPCHAAALSHAAPKILAYILASICWACAPERARRKRTEGIARAVQRAIEKKQRETVYFFTLCVQSN